MLRMSFPLCSWAPFVFGCLSFLYSFSLVELGFIIVWWLRLMDCPVVNFDNINPCLRYQLGYISLTVLYLLSSFAMAIYGLSQIMQHVFNVMYHRTSQLVSSICVSVNICLRSWTISIYSASWNPIKGSDCFLEHF